MQSSHQLNISRIVHGHWRLNEWKLAPQELLKLTQQCIELGVTSFDHADIYGNYSNEALFGQALLLKPELRQQLQIVTKCGIKLISEKYPDRKIKTYDYSYNHITNSVENSLKNLKTDYIDVLLLHRPSPFFNPEEVAKAFDFLLKSGEVRAFGVSNFSPQSFEMLQQHCSMPLVTNQIELLPWCLEHFDNGNMDFFLRHKIKPMAWSPLAGGRLLFAKDEKSKQIQLVLNQIKEENSQNSVESVVYSWLLMHPAEIVPVVGSGKIERIKIAVDALENPLTMEQWFRIFIAARCAELP